MEVCRLCLDLVATQGDAKPLDGETRDMVQVVAPELNLEASKNPSVCSECQKTLSRLFDFKSRVFEHEGEIREKVGDRRGTVSLKAAVTGEADPPLDPDRDKAKDRLCRTCLAPIECESFTVLRPSEPDAYLSSMLDMCLVEVDLALTKDPVMCEGCLDNLQKLHHFKSSCQDVEDKIVDYCNKNKLKESTVVDLHAVLESERPRDIEMLTVKDEDGASGSKIKDEEKEVEPKSEDEDEEMSEDEEEDEEMSEDEEVKQEELDIKSETEPGTSDSDNNNDLFHQELSCKDNIVEYDQNNSYATQIRTFKSDLCTYTFTSEDELLFHKDDQHKIYSFECSKCSLEFKFLSSLKLHNREQHEVDFSKCGTEPFDDKAHIEKLSADHKTSDDVNHENFTQFIYPYKLAGSLKSETSKTETKSSAKEKCERNKNLTKKEKNVRNVCTLCTVQFKSPYKLKLHRKNEHLIYDKHINFSKFDYKTNKSAILTNHEKTMHNIVPRASCNLCSAQFKSSYTLKLHGRDEHGLNVESFQCFHCKYKTICKRVLSKHIKAMHENVPRVKCSLCSAQFKSLYKLKLHRKDEHGLDVKYFHCSNCSYKAISKTIIKQHEGTVHRDGKLRKDSKKVHNRKQNGINSLICENKQFDCKIRIEKLSTNNKVSNANREDVKLLHCDSTQFVYPNKLRGSLKSGKSETETKRLAKERLKRNVNTNKNSTKKEKIVRNSDKKCTLCTSKFKSSYKLKLHRQNEHLISDKQLQCSKCDYKTNKNADLTKHEKYVHNKEPRVKCNLCLAQFKSRYKLKMHGRDEHGINVESFKCPECKYKTICKRILSNHIKAMHENVPRVKCSLCSAQFKSLYKLKFHRKDEHGIDVKYFHCSNCSYKAISKTTITKHENAVHGIDCEQFNANHRADVKLLHSDLTQFICPDQPNIGESKTVTKGSPKVKRKRNENTNENLTNKEKNVCKSEHSDNVCTAQFTSAYKLKLRRKNEFVIYDDNQFQ